MLALALGGRTPRKMARGHRGANHPVKDLTTGKVEITSQNHGFQGAGRQPAGQYVEVTHVSLFDGSNERAARLKDPAGCSRCSTTRKASPGPQDSHYLFQRFVDLIDAQNPDAKQKR